jgi:hypothetical protein
MNRPVADRVPIRLRLAWNCLRGRPVVYRVGIHGGLFNLQDAMIVQCQFRALAA